MSDGNNHLVPRHESKDESTHQNICTIQTMHKSEKSTWDCHTWNLKAVSKILMSSTEVIKLKATEDSNPSTVTIHLDLLCFDSRYYTAALKGSFQEAGKNFLEVETSADVLKMAVVWMYTGQLQTTKHSKTTLSAEELIQLYIFADHFDFLALRRAIITYWAKMNQSHCMIPDDERIGGAYDSLPENSPLLRYLVCLYTYHAEPWIEYFVCSGAPADFLLALVKEKKRKRLETKKFGDLGDCACCHYPCSFHEHEGREEEEATCGLPTEERTPRPVHRSLLTMRSSARPLSQAALRP
ncbi:hypothetical protein BDV97DRAFT_133617 [Delphinella strobiligena]|nr:hypothetical protein BDV97DRAFT_133617 [Delphinella strobiligena]